MANKLFVFEKQIVTVEGNIIAGYCSHVYDGNSELNYHIPKTAKLGTATVLQVLEPGSSRFIRFDGEYAVFGCSSPYSRWHKIIKNIGDLYVVSEKGELKPD